MLARIVRAASATLILSLALYGACKWFGIEIPKVEYVAAVSTDEASRPTQEPTPKPKVEAAGQDRVISIFLKSSLGHGCPISPTEALTAEHVVTQEDKDGSMSAPLVVWGDSLGNSGTAQWVWSDARRDISLIRTAPDTPPFPAFLRVAKRYPAKGEKVYLVGFKWDEGLIDHTVEATVLYTTAGTLIYSDTPGPGSSGSCVLNAAGEIVAINSASVNGSGLGLLVVGEWSSVPDQFKIESAEPSEK